MPESGARFWSYPSQHLLKSLNDEVIHVFITEYEGNNALFVTKRTGAGFVVQAKESKANGMLNGSGRLCSQFL
jgi:hypothetical protein